MAKFLKMEDGDPIGGLIKKLSEEMGLSRYVDVQPRYLKKPLKNNVGGIYKWNDVSETLTNRDNTIVVGVYGDAFDRVDEATQEFWVRNLLSQIVYDFDKDRITISKEILSVPTIVYQTYGIEAINKKELEIQVLAQIADEEREKKLMEKEAKKVAKKKK